MMMEKKGKDYGTIGAIFYFSVLALAGTYKAYALLSSVNSSLEQYLELIRFIFTACFFYLVVFSYLKRSTAKVKAQGCMERWLPLFITVAEPLFIAEQIRKAPQPTVTASVLGMVVVLYGWLLAIRALWHLKRSFSIMAEVRCLVTTGPYATVRHPLYLAETLILLGLALMVNTWLAYAGFCVFTGLQLYRASLEEAKFRNAMGKEYAEYRKKTGFFLPRLTRLKMMNTEHNSLKGGEVSC